MLIESIKHEYGKKRGTSLATEQDIKEHCRSFFEGRVFLSNTSKDHEFCEQYIVPGLEPFGLWSYFFVSVGGGRSSSRNRVSIHGGSIASSTARQLFLLSRKPPFIQIGLGIGPHHQRIVPLADDRARFVFRYACDVGGRRLQGIDRLVDKAFANIKIETDLAKEALPAGR